MHLIHDPKNRITIFSEFSSYAVVIRHSRSLAYIDLNLWWEFLGSQWHRSTCDRLWSSEMKSSSFSTRKSIVRSTWKHAKKNRSREEKEARIQWQINIWIITRREEKHEQLKKISFDSISSQARRRPYDEFKMKWRRRRRCCCCCCCSYWWSYNDGGVHTPSSSRSTILRTC